MRKMYIDVPSCGKRITATLFEDFEQKNVDEFWKFLEESKKCIVHPVISAGDLAVCFPRPPKEFPASIGNQTTPLTDKSPILCTGDDDLTVKLGDVLWNGYFFTFVYGDSMTEPLVSGGAKVGRVDEDSIEDLCVAGKDLWHHTIFYHKLATVIAGRKEK